MKFNFSLSLPTAIVLLAVTPIARPDPVLQFAHGAYHVQTTTPALAATLAEPWKRWMQTPLTIPVTVDIPTVSMMSNSSCIVTLADGLSSCSGVTNDCSIATNGPTLLANLCVRRPYTLMMMASNLSAMEMDLGVVPPPQMLALAGIRATPKKYSFSVNGWRPQTYIISVWLFLLQQFVDD